MQWSPWRRAFALLTVILAASSAAGIAVAHGVAHSADEQHGHGHSYSHDVPTDVGRPTFDHERLSGDHAHLEFDSRLPERPDVLLAPLARPTPPDFTHRVTARGTIARFSDEAPQGHSRASPRQPRAPPVD